jgi:hypothetical protein
MTDVQTVTTSDHSELPESERTTNYGLDLNPNQPLTKDNDEGKVFTTNDNQSSTMYENTASMYQENIYEQDVNNHLNSNEEFKLVTNKRSTKSNKGKVSNSIFTNTFLIKRISPYIYRSFHQT